MPVSRTKKSNAERRQTGPYVSLTCRTRKGIQNGSKCSPSFVVKIGRGTATLQPTIVFDTFWRFVAERNAIDQRRRQGLPQPWTDDPIFQSHRFCNVFRVLDRASQFLIHEVIDTGSQKPADVVFRVVLFNLFTKIETYQLLDDKLGPLTWESYDRAAYEEVLKDARDEGLTLYTGAFQKPAARLGRCKEAFRNHLRLLEAMMNGDLTTHLLQAKFAADVFAFIESFPGMADFTAYQLYLNLTYTSVINFSEMDFVVGGPGSRSGLSKCFGDSIRLPKMEVDVMRWMAETQDEHFARLALKFDGLGPEHLPLGLADIEHALCEVDKYSRMVHPQVQSRWTTTRKRARGPSAFLGRFKPSLKPYPKFSIPAAWAHPDRNIIRIKTGPRVKLNKRYVVDSIIRERTVNGEKEYLVDWAGYSPDEATWEPAENVLADAPDVVEEYEDCVKFGREPKSR